jgi:hypothetical protein
MKIRYTFALSSPRSVNASVSIVRISRFLFVMELIFCNPVLSMYERIEESQQAVAKVRWSTAWTTDKSTHTHADKMQTGSYSCLARWLALSRHWYDMIWYDMIWYDMIWYDMTVQTMIWRDMTLLRFSHGRDTPACASNFLQQILSSGWNYLHDV